MPKTPSKIIGWREWVCLPDLGVKMIKAKVDTGARSSSIHTVDEEFYRRNGREYVKFKLYPNQRDSRKIIKATAEVLEYRKIRSSNGHVAERPVIVTDLEILGEVWPIEITLSNRDEMGFRMLLGRESFRGKMLVDVSKSYYSKKPKRKTKTKVKVKPKIRK